MVDQHFRSGTMISTTFRYTGLGAATAMSVMARRLSACLPQEALVRRSSPTALDIASQISQLDAACPTPGAEDNGSAVCLETSIRPLNEENRGNSAGRRLSLDVTWLSTRVLHSDSRRASLRYRHPSMFPGCTERLVMLLMHRGCLRLIYPRAVT